MENNLEDNVIEAEDQVNEEAEQKRLRFYLKKTIKILTHPFRLIWAPKNRARFVILLMVGSVMVGGFWLLQGDRSKKLSTPLGSDNFNAMMAMSKPIENKPFFVYVSEKRTISEVSSDYFSLFPGIPIDSVAVALHPDESDSILFASAAFCLDWEALDMGTKKNVIAVQRGSLEDLGFLLGPSSGVEKEKSIDEIPVFSLTIPGHNKALFSIYGNVLLVADDRKDMIESIKALIHPMTRLSWNEGSSRMVRTFVEDDRRYRFFLCPEDEGAGQIIPRRIHQALSPSLLLNIAIRQADPEGHSEELLLWLTRKGVDVSNDTSYAFDSFLVGTVGYLCFVPRQN